jgi:DNA-binding transcriptional LysR family regulator
MMNIPTDLLRTLIAVVDLRSFTKAAQSLGVTQPAVSAQIKRLQFLIGYDLLDKSAPGVSLTQRGEIVVSHARRLLSINDEILHLTGARLSAQTLRIGIPGDYAATRVPAILRRFRNRWPDVRFRVTSKPLDKMLRDLQQGDLDLAITITTAQLAMEARHVWIEETVWVRSEATSLDPDGPVPLVSYGEDGICYRIAVACLRRVGRDCDVVFSSRSLIGLIEAVEAGLGIMVLPRQRVARANLIVWDDAPLPKPPEIYCGIYLREGPNRAALEELADELAAELRPKLQPAEEPAESVPEVTPIRASR